MSAGHIRRRGAHSWELKWDAGADPATGRRVTRYRSFKGTKRDAAIELGRLIAAEADGLGVDPSKLTLGDFLDQWLDGWAVHSLSPKTIERYRELLDHHVRPQLGPHRLQRLKPAQFVGHYAALLKNGRGEERGLAPRTVGHVHRVLHRAFGHAVVWGQMASSPLTSVKPPPVESTELEILDKDQIKQVLTSLRPDPLFTLAMLDLATGMRRGELLGLYWRDIEFENARLRVERSLEQTKAGLRFKPPKTRYGRRSIALPAYVVTELRRLWKEQQELALQLGAGRLPNDSLVFGNFDGSPRSPNAVTKAWAAAVSKYKLPKVTLHALRHTHASQLIAAGLDVLTISRRLGHGSPAITLSVYGHLFSNTDDRAAEMIQATFAGAVSTENAEGSFSEPSGGNPVAIRP